MMLSNGREVASIEIAQDRDVVRARLKVTEIMKEEGSRALMQTRFVTAVSEIARNAFVHGGGGILKIYTFPGGRKIGIECRDNGPGIPSVEKALSVGFSTTGSMGRGLGGAQRLATEFEILTVPGGGTTIRMIGATGLRR